MATRLRINRRVSGAAGAPATLLSGELAYNMADGTFYAGKGDNGSGVATSVVAFAKEGYVDPSTLYQPKDADLDAIAALDATTGLLVRSGAGAFLRRTLAGTAGRVTVANGDGAAGAPTIDLATVTVGSTTTGGSTKFTVDAYGRVTNQSQATLNDIAPPTATYSFGSQILQTSSVPAGSNDITNKAYVDQAILNAQLAGDEKDSVRLASTANTALSGGTAFPTFDGVVSAAGDRVLLRSQTAQAENGIYVVGGTAAAWTLTRAPDFDSWAEIPGAIVTVEEGATLADHLFISIANRGGTLGTTAIGFNDVTGGTGGFTVAGAGLTSSGGTIDVAPGAGISVAADTVALTGQALALHNLVTAANDMIYATGAGTFATITSTAFGRGLLATADAAALRTAAGLGTMATQNANAVAITGGTIDGVILDGGTF